MFVIQVLSLIVEYNIVQHFGAVVKVEDIVMKANEIFLHEQVRKNGK